jgi:hypothetical protein
MVEGYVPTGKGRDKSPTAMPTLRTHPRLCVSEEDGGRSAEKPEFKGSWVKSPDRPTDPGLANVLVHPEKTIPGLSPFEDK